MAITFLLGGTSYETAYAKSSYAECERVADQPACLLNASLAVAKSDPGDLLEAVVVVGDETKIEPRRADLIAGFGGRVTVADRFLSVLGVTGLQNVPRDVAQASSSNEILSAIALATAAQNTDHPFENAQVKRMLAPGTEAKTAALATLIWYEIDVYGDWRHGLTRPPGLTEIWRRVTTSPPDDDELLLELAIDMSMSGGEDEGLALLRTLELRQNTSDNTKAAAASWLARGYRLADQAQRLMDAGGKHAPGYDIEGIESEISQARLFAGYSRQDAAIIVRALRAKLHQPAFQTYLGQEGLDALEAGGAHTELRALGDAYLGRARQANEDPEDQAQWYALASSSYRRANLMDAALSAAREGLPYVAPAIAARLAPPGIMVEPNSNETTAHMAAKAGFDAEPVEALFAAGARGEASEFGYLAGLDRYNLARRANVPADAKWVADTNFGFHEEFFTEQLIAQSDTASARRFYDALNSRAPSDMSDPDGLETRLGLLAALMGDGKALNAHFARAALLLEDATSPEDEGAQAYFALKLAANWRRAQIILERVAAQTTK